MTEANRFTLRRARFEDAAAIAEVHVAAWRQTYHGIVPARLLANMSVAQRKARHEARLVRPHPLVAEFVAEERGQGIVGFAACGPERSGPPGYRGEFHAIYLLRRARGFGVGRRLMVAMAHHLQQSGLAPAYVMVLRDNANARRFYERLGGVYCGEAPFTFEGVRLMEVAYGWPELAPLTGRHLEPQGASR